MVQPTLTCVLTTINRPTLARTLASIKRQQFNEGDKLLLVSDGEHGINPNLLIELGIPGTIITLPGGPHYDWGHTPRNRVAHLIETSYVMHFDDDDTYLDGAWNLIRKEIVATPFIPLHFQMRWGDNRLLHQDPILVLGNVATGGFVHPNNIAKQGIWQSRYGGDFDFINQTAIYYKSEDYPTGIRFVDHQIALVRP